MIHICTEQDIFNYQAEYEWDEDARHWESINRCLHCELPLTEDGECRDEGCFSHEFDDYGLVKWAVG